jgi:hypothetical protein
MQMDTVFFDVSVSRSSYTAHRKRKGSLTFWCNELGYRNLCCDYRTTEKMLRISFQHAFHFNKRGPNTENLLIYKHLDCVMCKGG